MKNQSFNSANNNLVMVNTFANTSVTLVNEAEMKRAGTVAQNLQIE